MAFDDWDEVRTAYHVARLGTVSAAADVLGVHHATVIRHIDALEGRLGAKLFQRHARGYTATEAGQDLLLVAQATQDQLSQLAGRIKGRGNEVTGELVVTSVTSMSELLTPVLADFRLAHPELTVRFLTGSRLFRLEYGEAHVAIRAGAKPNEPDNVAQRFVDLCVGLYASRDYVERMGMPKGPDDFAGHSFVGLDDEKSRAPFQRWMHENIPAEQIVFKTNADISRAHAVRAGVGIGFLAGYSAHHDDDLVQIMPPRAEWGASTWLVTHVDLHRTAKVQTFLKFLKQAAKDWPVLG